MKILHVQDIDYLTTTPTLVEALKQVREWLKANPTSCPIMVLLELKQSKIPKLTKPVPFGERELDSVDKEILSVFFAHRKSSCQTMCEASSQHCAKRFFKMAGQS